MIFPLPVSSVGQDENENFLKTDPRKREGCLGLRTDRVLSMGYEEKRFLPVNGSLVDTLSEPVSYQSRVIRKEEVESDCSPGRVLGVCARKAVLPQT